MKKSTWGAFWAALSLSLTVIPVDASGTITIVENTLEATASAVTAVNFMLQSAYKIPWENGGISHKRPEEESERIRGLLVEIIDSMSTVGTADLVYWTGVGHKDGASNWIYPTNNSWVASPSPKYYNGERTNGYVFEQQENLTTSLPGVQVRHGCYWMSDKKNRQVELIQPKASSYMYDFTTRPFWPYLKANGDGWLGSMTGWSYKPQWCSGTNLYDPQGNLTGQAVTALQVENMEKKLVGAVTQVGGENGKNTWVFVMDEGTDLIIASLPKVAYRCPEWGSCVSNPGTNASDPVIRATVKAIIARQGQTKTDTFVLGSNLVQTKFRSSLGDLKLASGWLIVAVETIDCADNHYFDMASLTCKTCIPPKTSLGGSAKECGICEADHFMDFEADACKKCPEGTSCDGSSNTTSLEIKKGFWRIAPDSTDVMSCPWEEGCVGGTKTSQICNEGYQGILCASCYEDFYYSKDSNECISCGEPGVSTAVERVRASIILTIFFFFIIIFFGGALFVRFSPGLQGAAAEKITAFIAWANVVRLKGKMKFKCLMSFAQISATVSFNCGMRFPDGFETVMNIFSIANIEVIPALGVPCWLKQFDYINTMITMTVAPLCLCAVIFIVFVVNNLDTLLPKKEEAASGGTLDASRRPSMKRSLSRAELFAAYEVPKEMEQHFSRTELHDLRKAFMHFDGDQSGNFDKGEFLEPLKLAKPEATEEELRIFADECWREVEALGYIDENDEMTFTSFLEMARKSRKDGQPTAMSQVADQLEAKLSENPANGYIYAVLLVSFLVLPGSTTILFNFFKCREFHVPGEGTVSYMYKDYNIDCASDRYQGMIAYVIFMILIYPVGIPLSWSLMLWQAKDTVSDDKAMAREAMFGNPKTGHLSFLVESYIPKYYYFEVLDCIRRILLTSAIGLFDEDTPNSAIAGIIISMVFIFIFSEMKPFKASENSALGVLLMYTLTLIFLAALISKMGAVDPQSEGFGAVLMVVLFGSLALGAAISIFGTDPFAKKQPAEEEEAEAAVGDEEAEGFVPKEVLLIEGKTSRVASRLSETMDRAPQDKTRGPESEQSLAVRLREQETAGLMASSPLMDFEGSYDEVVTRLEKLSDLREKELINDESFENQVNILNKQLEMTL